MDILIIFDINGTIIQRDKRTDIPYAESIDKLLKTRNAMEGIDTSARSDKDVFMEVLEKQNIIFSDKLWQEFMSIYEKYLKEYKDTDIWRENANSTGFIRTLYSEGYPLTLVTGELSIGARYKLEKLGIWDCFPVGGFGEDGLKRFDIAKEALRKAKEYYKKDFNKVLVIGDTILDIKTARYINAGIISITTGSNTRDELSAHEPDLIIDDFQGLNINKIFSLIPALK